MSTSKREREVTKMTVWFDMDGTIANLYGVEDWLPKLIDCNPSPYAEAKPLLRLNTLARVLHKVQAQGHKVGIISWLSKNSNPNYDREVTAAKKKWLKTHLKSVDFDYINIVPYGTPKQQFCTSVEDILFDDEKPNRDNWTGVAHDVDDIIGILKGIA